MSYRVLVTKRAQQQIDAADEWWMEHRPSARDAIRDEVAAAIARLAEMPLSGSLVAKTRHPGDRRIILARVGYHLYYRVGSDVVEVLRFWCASRGTTPQL